MLVYLIKHYGTDKAHFICRSGDLEKLLGRDDLSWQWEKCFKIPGFRVHAPGVHIVSARPGCQGLVCCRSGRELTLCEGVA